MRKTACFLLQGKSAYALYVEHPCSSTITYIVRNLSVYETELLSRKRKSKYVSWRNENKNNNIEK